MAEWNEVKDYLKTNFDLQKDDDDFLKIAVELGEDWYQPVFIQKTTAQSGDVWVQIVSPVGAIDENDLNKALEMLNTRICGGLIKIGKKHYIRHSMLINSLSPEYIGTITHIVSDVADEMEGEFIDDEDN
ncbi:hypothetical protein K7I13_08750 [Brucepastera parasyntrophica]|uniref:hypothetical protein n=1 Tax=Brucepastera parasyntrophica TaxID=2880008 RepID=UPI002109CCBF|nr:hypothetical protein [Brucepastera parasyntrophica]ULQ58649.1 hypothetical protein K7I13_08750 [Brucepastera parasyntrophica]